MKSRRISLCLLLFRAKEYLYRCTVLFKYLNIILFQAFKYQEVGEGSFII